MTEKLKIRFEEFGRALARLKEAVNTQADDDIHRDAMVQRFEFTYELAWKTIKALVEVKGQDAPFPRDCFKKAYRGGWIDDEEAWFAMLKDRNTTSHVYKEKVVIEIASRIPAHALLMERLYQKLETEMNAA